jgi:branched-chain amino acid transport system permease protein
VSDADPDRSADGGAVVEGAPAGDPTLVDRYRAVRDRDWFVLVGTAVALLVFPFVLVDVLGAVGTVTGVSVGGYEGLPSLVLIYGIVVVGFNLLLGYTGLLSFGHAAFFGTAAYAAALFSTQVGSPLLMVVVGTVVAVVIAVPIGFVSIRRSGVYFAVLTLTFGQMLYFYALGPGAWLTNGDNGFSEVSISGVLGLGVVPLDTHVPLLGEMTYVLVAALTLLAVAAANRIVHSPYGLIFKALGENQQRVAFVGLNVDRYKLTAFVISAAFAGVGGALFTVHEGYIHPNSSLYWIVSGDFVIMTVLGGTGSLVGPMLGAFIFEYISNVVSGITLPVIGSIGSLWRLVLGAVFVVIVWALPRGVGGALRDLGGMVLRAADDDRDAGTATDGGEER